MSQSRIRSFFPAVPDDAYAAQLQRDRDEHAVAREQLLYQQAAMRARHCMEREAGAPRGVGRPRKRRVASIVTVCYHVISYWCDHQLQLLNLNMC